jgi:hypothetical protein
LVDLEVDRACSHAGLLLTIRQLAGVAVMESIARIVGTDRTEICPDNLRRSRHDENVARVGLQGRRLRNSSV